MDPDFLSLNLARRLENLGQGAICAARAQIGSRSCEHRVRLQTGNEGRSGGAAEAGRGTQGGAGGPSARAVPPLGLLQPVMLTDCPMLLFNPMKHPFPYDTQASLGEEIIFVLLS